MTTRLTFLAVFAGIHLALVVCGAAHLQPVANDNPLANTVATYGAASGADSSYSFFAPRVSPQLRAEFLLTDAAGKTWTDNGDWGQTSEARLRLLSSISMVEFEEFRDGVAASWAAAMFGRHPSAQSVEMRVQFQDLPSMEEFRKGDKPEWLPMFEAKFNRAERPAVTFAEPVRDAI